MSIVETISRLRERRDEELRIPPGFDQSADGDDTDEMLYDIEPEDTDAVKGSVVGIEYINSKEETSTRMVTMRRIYARDGLAYLNGHCHLRKRYRKFRLDRVLSVIDYRTGEVHDDPFPILRSFCRISGFDIDRPAVPSPLPDEVAILRAGWPGAKVLLYIARADNALVREELDVILNYLDEFSIMNGGPVSLGTDWDAIEDWLWAQFPDPDEIPAAVAAATSTPADNRMLVRAVRGLVEADGVVDPEETAVLCELADMLEAG